MSDHVSVEEQAQLKRGIYDKMNPRRRRFIDRIGYDNWDPFQKPNEPLDMRTDAHNRTVGQLINAFMRDRAHKDQPGSEYAKGALECAMGIVKEDEKFLGIMDFCLWYNKLPEKEGHCG